MGQKVRPTGFRTGIMVDWQSQWYANKADFAELESYILGKGGEAAPSKSGRQEFLENLVNEFIR